MQVMSEAKKKNGAQHRKNGTHQKVVSNTTHLGITSEDFEMLKERRIQFFMSIGFRRELAILLTKRTVRAIEQVGLELAH